MKTENNVTIVDYAGLSALMQRSSNKDLFNRLAFMDEREAVNETTFVITDQNEPDVQKIVAAAAMEMNPHEDNTIWLKYISVDENHRQQGHATTLTRTTFNYAAQAGYILEPSCYSQAGNEFLRPLQPRIHMEFPDLLIKWGFDDTITDGHKPYELEPQGYGHRKVFYR
jgi:predicted GNAT family acetyltransferase